MFRRRPQTAGDFFHKGNALYDQGDLAGAIRCFDAALRIDPNYKKAHYNKGNALRYQGDLAGAIRCYDAALRIDPNDKDAHNCKCLALRRKGDLAGAIRCYDEVLRIDPNYKEAHNYKGTALYYQGDLAGAIRCFDEALRIDPNYKLAHHNKGSALQAQGDLAGAIRCYDEALRIDPNCKEAHNDKGLALQAQGDLAGAIRCYDAALRIDPNYKDAQAEKRRAQESLAREERAHTNRVTRQHDYAPLVPTFRPADTQNYHSPSAPSEDPQASRGSQNGSGGGEISSSYLISYGDIQLGGKLGEGGFGEVFEGVWQHAQVAVKQLHIQQLTEEALEEFQREAKIMANLHHPNVLPLYGVCIEPGHYSMVLKYMPKGSLYSVLHSQAQLTWPERWHIALGVGRGVLHLHTRKILHRDLKSLNILLSNGLKAKVGDFGLSKVRVETKTQTRMQQSTQEVGTIPWMAPELFLGGNYTRSCDVYSFGMILWEISSRENPYANFMLPMLVMMQVQQGHRENIPQGCPPSFASLIRRCWDQRAEQRPTMEQAVQELETNRQEAARY